jgi:hypothetical protein
MEKLLKEVKAKFVGQPVNHIKYGQGIITDILNIEGTPSYCVENSSNDILLQVKFEDGSLKGFSLATSLERGMITIDSKLIKYFNTTFATKMNLIVEAEENQRAEEYRLEEELRKARIEEEKYQKRVARELAKLKEVRPEAISKLFDAESNQYVTLGWMARHVRNIKPSMPDYMEPWFISHFGDVERYVVDSRKKTSGGFQMQWGLSLAISFDKEVSGSLLAKAKSKNKKLIDNVSFVWDLIENWGFKFGKEQSLEAIEAEIPERYIEDFQYGYSL